MTIIRRLTSCWRAHARLARFELLDRSWPVLFEQPSQGSIGEQSAAGLACRTVVRLVLGVHDALNGRATHRARLPIASVNGHVFAERSDLLREATSGIVAQALDPFLEHLTRGGEQLLHLALGQRVR